jgi:hypothetical protein
MSVGLAPRNRILIFSVIDGCLHAVHYVAILGLAILRRCAAFTPLAPARAEESSILTAHVRSRKRAARMGAKNDRDDGKGRANNDIPVSTLSKLFRQVVFVII